MRASEEALTTQRTSFPQQLRPESRDEAEL
jgi:hypothetical protein